MKNIFDIKKEDLINILKSINIEKYHAVQIFEWLHKKNIESIDDMSNINKDLREYLKNNFTFFKPMILKIFESKIDDTKKFLIKLYDDNIIECVLLNYEYGKSLCISSQVGCGMGCKLCASTIGGFVRDLNVYEMLMQVYLVEKELGISINNIVVMGIGEPLLNLNNLTDFLDIISDKNGRNISARNITISTCGIIDSIDKISNQSSKFTLALSLHAPNDDIRKTIMPIANKYNISDTLDAIAKYYKNTKRRITIEYALIKNINDSNENAEELYNIFKKHFLDKHIDFNINLILANEVKETNIERPDNDRLYTFKSILDKHKLNVTVRRELGRDISGSCGMLRRDYYNQSSCKN